ncbi:class I SAM-dependent methyltransferase [Pseudalkalibacillus berkeleyi]|uniref:Class I SAM-dependent methyltransferase n=1 Tax=Pseudalkalibacillus berkeleyi TaxID=1069813 RepID=A0ABS9H4S2_9BACL|nr:class I SAM-dependent methyltransferase [Pseudalkalibacillus berkeleyi]MCF6138944.1 class I SAM-dependent methyltransferase [Pseudalkalibacillus berkeleyi]
MDLKKHNEKAWDRLVEKGDGWTVPVSAEEVEKARDGEWDIVLTPTKPIPKNWFPSLKGKNVLCLASGGGQQGPILAAAGANVTVFDQSNNQLAQDQYVAERDGLKIQTVQGSMDDLSVFEDCAFDLIIHPVSNVFIEDVLPVWKEAFRVLKPGGSLLSGSSNPLLYIFSEDQMDQGNLIVEHSIPYSDVKNLSKEKLEILKDDHAPFQFGHTLEDLIQGQISAGFMIAGFYEDNFGGKMVLDQYINSFFATKAVKFN